jgi:hypothetical protein
VNPPAHCQAELAEINARIWWTQTLPKEMVLASGYVLLAVVAIERWRRRRTES